MTATTKSPFYVIEEFISPKQCEIIVDSLQFIEPDYDQNDNALKTDRSHEDLQQLILSYVQDIIPELEEYYTFNYEGMKQVTFSWYPETYPGDKGFTCENSMYTSKKWVRHLQRDFTGVLFLSDYNDNVPFDGLFEVFGGKYEFPQHNFGFNAKRGTLVIYPSGPHFLNRVTSIELGDLFIAKFHICADKPWLYEPSKFPGTYVSWFEQLS